MPEETKNRSCWENVKPREDGVASKELWRKRKELKQKIEKIQKLKKNNAASLAQQFDT